MPSPSAEGLPPADSCFCDERTEALLDVDEVMTALSHPCRRKLLCLLDADPEWQVSRLVEHLEEGEVSVEDGATTGTEVEVLLHHQHLPCLQAANLVTVVEEDRVVRRGEDFSLIREMVEAATLVVA